MSTPQDQIVIEGGRVVLNLLYGGVGGSAHFQAETTLKNFLDGMRARLSSPEPWSFGLAPSGIVVRDLYLRNDLYVLLVEVAPGPRIMSWLRDDSPASFGGSATYRTVTVALPWQYFFVTLSGGGHICVGNSVYFLNRQLQRLDEPLLEPHFYNCSVDAHGYWCWICSQGFAAPLRPQDSFFTRAHRCIELFWSSGFNLSSEFHEGKSFFGKNCSRIADRRVRTIDAWEKATTHDPEFALSVPWVTAPRTAWTVYDELTRGATPWSPTSATDLAPLIRSPKEKGAT